MESEFIIDRDDPVLITGSNGFIGSRVVERLLTMGFNRLRCFVRPSSKLSRLEQVIETCGGTGRTELLKGNLLVPADCERATAGARLVLHLAAGIDKSFAGAFMNSVVSTRNLLEATRQNGSLRRFVNVSSFAVYSNRNLRRGTLLDENCEVERHPERRHEAYCFGKVKQDEIVQHYGKKYQIPYVIVRPGAVFGPGKTGLSGRVGIDTFGFFLHLGGSNRLPLTYVDNCAEAIVLAGLKGGVDGEVFNVVDDDLPRSRTFLKLYKRNVHRFRSIPVPYPLAYLLCTLWEKYSDWSGGQLPPVFNRSRCSTEWKGNRYSNQKLKTLLGWKPRVPFSEACSRYFESFEARKEPC